MFNSLAEQQIYIYNFKLIKQPCLSLFPDQVLPTGFFSFIVGGGSSINISLTAAPAGIIGKTLSALATSASIMQGPSL